MAVVVVDRAELGIVVFTAPPDGGTRCRPIASSPLRGKRCAFVQSPYKPSGALTRSREAAQGGNGTPDPSGVRRMSQGLGG